MSPVTSPRESAVEARLVRGVTAAGGRAFKIAPTTAGLPDRLVLLPGGVTHLVELKTDRGRLSPIQVARHAELSALGAQLFVLHGPAEVEAYLLRHASRRAA